MPQQGAGFPQGSNTPGFPPTPQYGGPQNLSTPFNAGPASMQKERLTYLAMCGIPLVIAFISLFLPYFTISSAGYSESISWAQGDSGGPFIFALIFILVAIVPLVMLFIPRVNSKQLYSSASLVTAAGVVIIGNVIYNWGPKELDDLDLDSLGIEVSRSIGFWLLLVSGIGLVVTGILFARWAQKQAKQAPVAPYGAPYTQPYPAPAVPYTQGTPGGAPFTGNQAPFGAPQAPSNQQFNGAQAPGGQPFGAPQAPAQFGNPAQPPYGAPQSPVNQPESTPFGGSAPQQTFASPQSPVTPPPVTPSPTGETGEEPSEGTSV